MTSNTRAWKSKFWSDTPSNHRASSFSGCTLEPQPRPVSRTRTSGSETTSLDFAWLCIISDTGNDDGQGCIKPPQLVSSGIQLGGNSAAQYEKGTMDSDRRLRV